MTEFRCLSLWQPYASAVALGLKRLETRHWSTPYRGRILIHAARRWTPELARFQDHAAFLLAGILDSYDPRIAAFRDEVHPLGFIVAMADLVEVWPTDGLPAVPEVTALDELLGDFRPGRFAWQLENVVQLAKPIPCRGQQGLWAPGAAVVDAVALAVA